MSREVGLNKEAVLAHRMLRQGLSAPASDEKAYSELLRLLQPVAPVHNTKPGSAPRLPHRATFDDGVFNDGLRGRSALVKGRFLGGNIGYVLAEDLALYGTVFRSEVTRFAEEHERVMQALRFTGCLTPRQLADETGLTNKRLMPLLHRLQRGFLVYEAQEDSSWERGWSLFEAEWPHVDLQALTWEEAASRVLDRFLESHVFATFTQLRDWSQLPVRALRRVVQADEAKATWLPCCVNGLGEGWVRAVDRRLSKVQSESSVFMLHKSDALVKSHASELKEKYGDLEVLQYLLIDGVFAGAVCGHWRIGPHDVEDVVVQLSDKDRRSRQQEIVDAVSQAYHPPHSEIRRYAGESIA